VLGKKALCCNVSGNYNVAIGYVALGLNTGGVNNIGIGKQANCCSTTGCFNVAIGTCALRCNSVGRGNVALGYRAAESSGGRYFDIAIGYKAGMSTATASCCQKIAIGYKAGYSQCCSPFSISIGQCAGASRATCAIAIGCNALLSVNGLTNTIAIGNGANELTTSAGCKSIALGYRASRCSSVTPVNYTIAIGPQALYCGGTCASIAIGKNALFASSAAYCSFSGFSNVAIGNNSLGSLTCGINNIALGESAGPGMTTASNNILIGKCTGKTNGNGNIAVGCCSHFSPTGATGYAVHQCNIAIGMLSMRCTSTAGACQNIAIGTLTLKGSSPQSFNIAIGYSAGNNGCLNVTIGAKSGNCIALNSLNNTFLGSYAGQLLSTNGNGNTVLGFKALSTATINISGNVAIGDRAMYCSAGINNVVIGRYALSNFCSAAGAAVNAGSCNIVIGFSAGCASCLGCLNSIIGLCAMSQATQSPSCNVIEGAFAALNFQSGNGNTAIGFGAFRCLGTGTNNVAVGTCALSGSGSLCASSSVSNSVAVGTNALYKSVTGCSNVAVGFSALCNLTTGFSNIAIGDQAGFGLSTGFHNTVIGKLSACLNGKGNTAIGYCSLRVCCAVDSVHCNTAIGYKAMGAVAADSCFNVAIGPCSFRCRSGIGNINIGYCAGNGGCQNIVIGTLAAPTMSSAVSGNTCFNTIIGGYAAQRVGGCSFANTVLGFKALNTATAGVCGSVVIGERAMYCASGNQNIVIGRYALSNFCSTSTNNSGGCNIVVGLSAACAGCLGCLNIIMGGCAMGQATQSPACNIAIGAFAALNFQSGNGNTAIGFGAFRCLGTGTNNVAVGTGALSGCGSLCASSSVSNSVAIGYRALYKSVTGCSNVAVGFNALCGLTTGFNNIAIGDQAGLTLSTGTNNIAIGKSSGNLNGKNNLAIGYCALKMLGGIDSVQSNIALGYRAAQCNCSGCFCFNIALGICTLHGPSSSPVTNNIAIGYCAGNGGFHNIMIGTGVGAGICTCNNVLIGSYAGQRLNVAGTSNTAVGFKALTTSGAFVIGNVAIGERSMYCSNGCHNTVVGRYALSNFCSAAGAATNSGCFNVVLGFSAACAACLGNGNIIMGSCAMGQTNQSPACNISIGPYSALNFQNGGVNVVMGCNAFRCLGTGSKNVAIGAGALAGNGSLCANSLIDSNVAVGYRSLYKTISGCNNVAIGPNALCANITGNCSIAIGRNALCGTNSVTGCNVAIGDNAGPTHTGYNAIMIGAGSAGAATGCNNFISIGNGNIACARVQVAWTVLSDCRDKTNIQGIPIGLDFIKAVRPVKFTWDQRDAPNDGKKGMTQSGFTAQNLDEAVQQFDAEWMGLVNKDESDRWMVTHDRLLPVVVKAIQELEEKFAALTTRVNTLEQNL